MKCCYTQEPPIGYTFDHNPAIWNVGHVFFWSAPFDQWTCLDERISIKPEEPLADAFARQTDYATCELGVRYAVLFVDGF